MDVTSEIKDRIATRVGPQRFKVWFKNATQFTLAEGCLKVGVPNQFIGGWLERHFAEAIVEAARDVLGQEVSVTYALDPGLVRNLRKTQLNSQAACLTQAESPRGRRAEREGAGMGTRRLRLRLDDFVVGPSNRMAFVAIAELAQNGTAPAAPLFLHGGCGLGKTHLLHGLANALAERRNGAAVRWAYVSAEEFTNQFVSCVRGNGIEEFRRRFRELDVLLVDDVHFLANKRATQDEFLHTFNAIDTQGRRVVLASDVHPRIMGQMCEALINRFMAAMILRLDPPDFATRCAILRRRWEALGAARNGRGVVEEVVEYVAGKIQSNVRELEGALVRLLALASMSDGPVTLSLARQALEEHVRRTEPMLTLAQIETVVATYFGLTPAELHTSRKSRTISQARSVAMFLARRHTGLSYPEIARNMGNKDHSTVLLACRRVEEGLRAGKTVTWNAGGGPRSRALADVINELEGQFRQ